MDYNWKEFLTFAENINADPDIPGPKEAALRSAVSRAYYAAFRAALEIGIRDGFSPSRTGEDHSKIREYFRNSVPKIPSKLDISTQLARLHDLRRKADYENELRQKPESMAYNAIGMAKKVFADIDELMK